MSICDFNGYVSVDTDGDGYSDCEESTGNDDPATTNIPTSISDGLEACDPDSTDTD